MNETQREQSTLLSHVKSCTQRKEKEMRKGLVKIKYINGYGKEEIGYTTKDEIEEARQGARSFVFFTDDERDIRNGKVVAGCTLDYLDITKIFDAE